jgi:hypothetical protein
VFSSGCHSFWRNDFFQPLYEAHSGVILLGAMRSKRSTPFSPSQTGSPVYPPPWVKKQIPSIH